MALTSTGCIVSGDPSPDAGNSIVDAGVVADAGSSPETDGGLDDDAGTPPPDGGNATACAWGERPQMDACMPSTAQSYIKASNPDSLDRFGASIAVSGDGNTLAVGAIGEDSDGLGVGTLGGNNNSVGSGAVYVFTRSSGSWVQQALLKASNADWNDGFGSSVALSADGNTLAVGAAEEDSDANTVNSTQSDNSAPSSGAVYIYVRNAGAWELQAYLKAAHSDANDFFGISLSMSADGNTLAVGADYESSAATGVNADATDNSAPGCGAAYIFVRTGTAWSQQAYLKPSNAGVDHLFGQSLSISADGHQVAVGAPGEATGAVYLFQRSGSTWTALARFQEALESSEAAFGRSVALSGDGQALAVGAPLEGTAPNALEGAVFLYTFSSGLWSPALRLRPQGNDADDGLGTSVSFSNDGSILAIGAAGEASISSGLNGDKTQGVDWKTGATYIYQKRNSGWTESAYVKASNPESLDEFGHRLALSQDGRALVVSARHESSGATGINGDGANNGAPKSGAVYVFDWTP